VNDESNVKMIIIWLIIIFCLTFLSMLSNKKFYIIFFGNFIIFTFKKEKNENLLN